MNAQLGIRAKALLKEYLFECALLKRTSSLVSERAAWGDK